MVTTPLSLTGDPAPALWLVVARTGGLLALAGAWMLAARIGGTAAGAAAAGAMALSPWWLFNTALANSEGLLAAAVLWAVLAHLAGRTRAALALGTAAALLRPEVWPFLGLYGLWLWRTDRAARPAVAVAAVLVPALWLGPDLLGIGGALSASRAARGEPSLGSAALEDVPGLAVLADAVSLLTVPAALAAVAGAILGGPLARVLAAGAAAWIAIVAVMAQAGYAGNPRYLVAAMAYGCVLAGVGAARVLPPAGPVALVAAVGIVTAGDLRDQVEDVGARGPAVGAARGGRRRRRARRDRGLRARAHGAGRPAAGGVGARHLDGRHRPAAGGAGRRPAVEPARRRADGARRPRRLRPARPGSVLGGLGRV